MSIDWFQCGYCGTTIKKDSSPDRRGCSANNTHTWYKLAEVGDTNYNCKKCNTTIQAKNSPDNRGCRGSGGSNSGSNTTTHSWSKV